MIKGHPGTTLTDAANLSVVPTPTSSLGDKAVRSRQGALNEAMRNHGPDLAAAAAALATVPTPQASDMSGGGQAKRAVDSDRRNLNDFVMLSTVATPAAQEPGGTPEQQQQRKQNAVDRGHSLGVAVTGLSLQAQLATVTTPSARDWKDTSGMSETGVDPDGSTRTRLDQLPRQAQLAVSGATATGTTAETESTGQLDPAYSLWLLGFPPEWANCAPVETPSRRRSRRSSSES